MSEFKQTIGRGTRIKERFTIGDEEYSKMHFVIIDFRKNYLKFDDPEFDGTVEVINGGTAIPCPTGSKGKQKRELYRIKNVNVEVVGHLLL